ncbi:3-deoxy-manno-octulosonate cytidylyltransferase [Anaerohalosphaera lusitana]|uniref:3-deoxy-manno-octulosonate cytidylyltransferase n=1 Tax=Anaerohalosphaera lusitana TaxID=1936003 RepID=A0A1U9NLZ8_9BACT|nr:3-deoxy-manno-octulosonate cytidylyltransferase [Anaerohalosphaera lusitana]AQT68610.1 3-deoxy-manno-octulosonate cytidylyltransferase [Anaerohalosphaera lusitana]
MKTIIVIPARYDSTRFPGKVLADDTGKFLVQHTYERALCAENADEVLIATDSEKVLRACESFGAKAVMTSGTHQSGTDRIAEAVTQSDAELVVNLQADEPEIDPAYIDKLIDLLKSDEGSQMATLVSGFGNPDQVKDPNVVKVVTQVNGRAIYFSRSPIPFSRESNGVGDLDNYLRHLGVYAYRREFLTAFTSLPQGELEKTEKLEQLRALENGYSIITGKVEHTWDGIDTAEQYAQFVKRIKG